MSWSALVHHRNKNTKSIWPPRLPWYRSVFSFSSIHCPLLWYQEEWEDCRPLHCPWSQSWGNPGKRSQGMYCRRIIHSELIHSGRTSFWGDAYTIRKWTGNLSAKIRKCVPTKGNREMNATFQKHLQHYSKFIKWFSKIKILMFFANDARFPFTYSHIFCDRLRHVLFETCWDRVCFFLAYAVRIASWFCIQLDFYAYYMQKFVLTWPLIHQTLRIKLRFFMSFSWELQFSQHAPTLSIIIWSSW